MGKWFHPFIILPALYLNSVMGVHHNVHTQFDHHLIVDIKFTSSVWSVSGLKASTFSWDHLLCFSLIVSELRALQCQLFFCEWVRMRPLSCHTAQGPSQRQSKANLTDMHRVYLSLCNKWKHSGQQKMPAHESLTSVSYLSDDVKTTDKTKAKRLRETNCGVEKNVHRFSWWLSVITVFTS